MFKHAPLNPKLGLHRIPPRRRVTLIAAFLCEDGALICADSQETIGDHRVARQKIEPFSLGSFELLMGGSGDGDAIDAFVQAVQDEWDGKPKTIAELSKYIRIQLRLFMRDEISLLPEDRRDIKFVIAAHNSVQPEMGVWETKATRLIPVKKYALLGCDYTVYERAVQRSFHEKALNISRAIPLAMSVFMLAEDTSNYVRSPFTLVAVTPHCPIYVEQDWYVRHYIEQAEVFSSSLERLFLICADSTVHSADFEQAFREFSETILQLRQDYFQATADLEAKALFASGKWPGFPFQRLPHGTSISFDASGTKAEEMSEAARAEIRAMVKDNEEFIQRLKQHYVQKVGIGSATWQHPEARRSVAQKSKKTR